MIMKENKINIAEILKNCPKGMELDCTMFDDVKFIRVEEDNKPICIRTGAIYRYLTKFGTWTFDDNAKCIIFPKGKTTWEGFQRPFKDGDILVGRSNQPFIFEKLNDGDGCYSYCGISCVGEFWLASTDWTFANSLRFATEEEKKKLFDAIKDNGYRWNAETKTLEKLVKPKFEVGDVIQDIDTYKVKITEVNIEDECYEYESMIAKGIGSIGFSKQDNWELVPNKFDITTLKPFESRVLVRGDENCFWEPAIFGFYNEVYFHVVGGTAWRQCIPYEGNEHLLGTTNDCANFYKTWE
jgi:hypothetical protein